MAKFALENSTGRLSGRLAKDDVIALWSEQSQLLDPTMTTLDLSQLEYVDSAGIAFLFHIQQSQLQSKNPLVLVNPAKQLQPLIKLYNLQDCFD
ncbi:MAG: STAS domain-containing protein [Parashewanella sp.]